MFCVGTYRTRTENKGFAWEPMQNIKKTQVLRWNLLKRKKNTCVTLGPIENTREILFCVGTYRKHKENNYDEWELIENDTKT